MIARILLLFFLSSGILFSQTYPDQFYNFEKDSLVKKITTMSGIQAGSDGKSIVLSDGALSGYAEFQPDSSAYPFNQGLPSWNGRVPNDNSSFRVLMRFYTNGWSPWLTAGYWKAQIWSSYGTTSYAGGRVNIDEIEMNSYCSKWQFRVEMMRTSASQPSPKVQKLSFFVSDTKTTTNYNLAAIVNDKPASVFIPTQHFYQYALDPEIGGSICSPTSVSMVIRSYNIKVDPLQFARDNYDNYFGQFGLWPRVVQHAAEFGLKGAVTRYRTWSEARKVLAAGGRVVMSVGKPISSAGHLIMLAGFDENGNPIVHDPGKSSGYSYKYIKDTLSKAWFSKGGVSYTFYLEDSSFVTSVNSNEPVHSMGDLSVINYPNPFNLKTVISIVAPQTGYTRITVYDITGREIERIHDGMMAAGAYLFRWNAAGLPSGNYFIHVVNGNSSKTVRTLLLK